MKAAVVTIGDEILIGQIIDTNSSYIAKALDKSILRIEDAVMDTLSQTPQPALHTLHCKLDLTHLNLHSTHDDDRSGIINIFETFQYLNTK